VHMNRIVQGDEIVAGSKILITLAAEEGRAGRGPPLCSTLSDRLEVFRAPGVTISLGKPLPEDGAESAEAFLNQGRIEIEDEALFRPGAILE
jgi:hypothetical protein